MSFSIVQRVTEIGNCHIGINPSQVHGPVVTERVHTINDLSQAE